MENKMSAQDTGCCSCGSGCCSSEEGTAGKRHILIDFMYIDLTTCDRCLGTEASLDEAIAEVSALLQSAGYALEVHKILVETEEQARQLGFVSSPTIRINGQDIQLDFKESLCGCCGEIAGQDIDCRAWLWQGQEYTTPPKAMLVDAILRYVYGGAQAAVAAKPEPKPVPDNLKRFFAAENG